jgi:hypothetical protein
MEGIHSRCTGGVKRTTARTSNVMGDVGKKFFFVDMRGRHRGFLGDIQN